MLMLCSNGLTSMELINCIAELNGRKAALVVTADDKYKEKNYHVPENIRVLSGCGLTVDIFDLDFQPVGDLLDYDVVCFIGGNPYYLLKSLRENNAKDVLLKIAEDNCLIGWSAGALVMGPDIGMIDMYSPEMNEWGINDLTGMCLTDVRILPHYDKFLSRYERFEERCREYEQANDCFVIRINDGEGVVIDKEITVIRKNR